MVFTNPRVQLLYFKWLFLKLPHWAYSSQSIALNDTQNILSIENISIWLFNALTANHVITPYDNETLLSWQIIFSAIIWAFSSKVGWNHTLLHISSTNWHISVHCLLRISQYGVNVWWMIDIVSGKVAFIKTTSTTFTQFIGNSHFALCNGIFVNLMWVGMQSHPLTRNVYSRCQIDRSVGVTSITFQACHLMVPQKSRGD